MEVQYASTHMPKLICNHRPLSGIINVWHRFNKGGAMCTSFISRKNDTIIGMNFDNNGMKYSIEEKHEGWFVVMVDGGSGKHPSFGVDQNGRFFNNLIVNSNGKGLYRRPSSKVTYTTKLFTGILDGIIVPEHLQEYLEKVEVVNVPDWSCHNMICDSAANVWIIEPGRGNIHSPANESSFFVMTNFSLVDMGINKSKIDCERYETAVRMLTKADEINIDSAFEILQEVSQKEGEWMTEFSMVFSKNKGKLYYCQNRNFENRYEYDFKSQK